MPALDMLSLILSADQTNGCKSTPMAYTTKVQYRAGEGSVTLTLRLYDTKLGLLTARAISREKS